MDSTKQAGSSPSSGQVGTCVASELNPSKYVDIVKKKLINRQILIKLEDGGSFCGTFYCIDKQGNIILKDAVENRVNRRNAPSSVERVPVAGLILIPITSQRSCHIDCSVEEQMSHLSVSCKNKNMLY